MEIKDYIKGRRKELGLTLEQVGDYVGVKKATVQKWESGYIADIGRNKIAKLAEILKISPLDIIYDEVNPSRNMLKHNHKETIIENDQVLKKIISCYKETDDVGRNALAEQAEFIQSKHPKPKSKIG